MWTAIARKKLETSSYPDWFSSLHTLEVPHLSSDTRLRPCYATRSIVWRRAVETKLGLCNQPVYSWSIYYVKILLNDINKLMIQAAANQRKARLTNVASDDRYIVLHQILTVFESQKPYPPSKLLKEVNKQVVPGYTNKFTNSRSKII